MIYIRDGEILENLPKAEFQRKLGKPEESLEEIFLRLEREARS